MKIQNNKTIVLNNIELRMAIITFVEKNFKKIITPEVFDIVIEAGTEGAEIVIEYNSDNIDIRDESH